jgi:hypothetical protein
MGIRKALETVRKAALAERREAPASSFTPAEKLVHERVVAPFRTAFGSGEVSLARRVEEKSSFSKLHVLRSEGQLFPVLEQTAAAKGGRRVMLFPPTEDMDVALSVSAEGAPVQIVNRKVALGPDRVLPDAKYGAELSQAVDAVLAKVKTAKGDDVPAEAPDGFSAPKGKSAVLAVPGPPIGHDLLEAGQWNGVGFAVTSERQGDRPLRLWAWTAAAEGTGVARVWLNVETPPAKDFPCRGASVFEWGGKLHVVGGIGADGSVLRSHWTYPLNEGQASGYKADVWHRERPLPAPRAFATAVLSGKQGEKGGALPELDKAGPRLLPYLVGGVGSVSARGEPVRERTLYVMADGRWQERAAPPSHVTRATGLRTDGGFYVGPGSERNGKILYYDRETGGQWRKVPDLPAKVGLGQLSWRDGEVVYSGGFHEDGSPSSAEYSLGDWNDGWRKLGDNPLRSGAARTVALPGVGSWSLMVKPGVSQALPLEKAK